jgi:hypothetical protein
LAHYRAALQPDFQGDVESLGPLPRYHIIARLDPSGTTLNGVERVILPEARPAVAFRLYPNLANYNGVAQVTAAQADSVPVEVASIANNTAILLTPPHPALTVDLTFEVAVGQSEDGVALFGWSEPLLSLPGFYPTLAVPLGDGWVLDAPPEHGDVLFNEMALYQLDLTLPQELIVVASGVTLSVLDNGDGSRTWQIAGGPLRDMMVMAGPFEAISDTAAGATVTSYYLAGHEAAGLQALTHAKASLQYYSDFYGRYPYTELDVVEAPLDVYGMEYSGLVLIGTTLYEPEEAEFLTYLTAHEVAHQWWYGLIGNNPYQHPWLDEGLTEYSAFDYYRHAFGQQEAERMLTDRWLIPFSVAARGGIAGVVDRPAADFEEDDYGLLVYIKAALFFNALRARLGDDTYRQVMQTYYAENRYRIATPQIFLATAGRVSGENLNPLAEQWLRR